MKLTSRIVAGALLLATPAAFSSGTASATASANILTAISLTEAANLAFGDVTASASSGTVVVSTAGARSVTGGVTASGGTITNASFTASGTNNHTFSINLPGDSDVTVSDGSSHSMTVTTFTSNPSSTGTLNGSGSATIAVGATLNVGTSQAVGAYTGTFNVTVAYN